MELINTLTVIHAATVLILCSFTIGVAYALHGTSSGVQTAVRWWRVSFFLLLVSALCWCLRETYLFGNSWQALASGAGAFFLSFVILVLIHFPRGRYEQ